MAVEPAEGDVPGSQRDEAAIDGRKLYGELVRASLGERLRPERVKVRGLRKGGRVRAQFVERQVVCRHRSSVVAPVTAAVRACLSVYNAFTRARGCALPH